MARPPNDDLKDMIEKIQAAGYKVKRGAKYVKKTYDVEEDLWEAVNQMRMQLKPRMTLRDVFSEALRLWLAEKNKSQP